jgi:hypothetical protein
MEWALNSDAGVLVRLCCDRAASRCRFYRGPGSNRVRLREKRIARVGDGVGGLRPSRTLVYTESSLLCLDANARGRGTHQDALVDPIRFTA